jgi:3-hydroxybutyryl-CoA dehydratase
VRSEREFAIDEIEVGHTFSPLVFPIDEELIAKYVEVAGDRDPLHRDPSCARTAGYRGVVAPPTIAALYVLKAYRTDSVPPPGGVHFRQRFKFYRPIVAGDVLCVRASVVDKYVKKGRQFLVIESTARNQHGKQVVWSESTSFWSR